MKSWLQTHWILPILVVLAFLIMVPHLERPTFWQDEAETALLSRSILQNGIPKAWDGHNLITQLSGNDSNSRYVWSFTPWLPFYIVAASFKVFGESHTAGRLPFVVIGILGLAGLYLFTNRWGQKRNVSFLASLFLLLNMQFILYSRQCKYYSLLFLLPLLLYFYYPKMHKSLFAFFAFVFFAVLLFYTNYVSLLTALVGLILYTFIVKRETRAVYFFIAAGVFTALVTLPFFWIGGFGVSSTLISHLPSFVEYFEKLGRHIWYFNTMAMGLLLFIPLAIFCKKGFYSDSEKNLIRLILWLIIPAWLVLPLLGQDVFRYNLHLIPLFSALSALIAVGSLRWSSRGGTLFLVVMLTTNLFANFPAIVLEGTLKTTGIKMEDAAPYLADHFHKSEEETRKFFRKFDSELEQSSWKDMVTRLVLKSEYGAYWNEIRGNSPDAIQAVVEFLRERAQKGDKVYGNFGQLSLAYYLPELHFVSLVDPERLFIPKDPPLPQYITSPDEVRWYYWRDVKMNLGPYVTHEEFVSRSKGLGKRLVPFDLGVSDLYWDLNRPQRYKEYINKRLWRDTRGYENVVVYKVQ